MLSPHVADNGVVKVVAGHFERVRNDRAAKGNDGDVRGAAADVDDHVAAGLRNVDARADGRRDRLFNDEDFARAGVDRCVFNRFPLHFRNVRRHTDRDPRAAEGTLSKRLADEVTDHFLRDGIVRDDACTKRPDRLDVSGGPADHLACFLAVSFDFIRRRIVCHDRRLF